MNELEIKRHNFDVAKNRLKEFSEKSETDLVIKKVQTDFLCRWFDHKVTGKELNDTITTIQGHLIDLNTTSNKIIKEFRGVYTAFDVLDKEYITGLVANVKAIEKTNNDVRKQQKTLQYHNDKLNTQQNKLDIHQTEIDKNIENMKKIITTLKHFKEKLDGFKHLTDIDKIWYDCKTMRNNMQIVSDSIAALAEKTKIDLEIANSKNKALLAQVNKEIIDLQKEAEAYIDFFSNLSEKLDSTANLLDEQIPVIQDVSDFTCKMRELSHLQDIDQVYTDLDGAKTHIVDLFKNGENYNKQLQIHQTIVDSLKEENKNQDEKIDELSKGLTEANDFSRANRNSIEELQSFRNSIDMIEHISDIDYMWSQENLLKENLEDANSSILSLKDKTAEIDKDIIDKSNETLEKIATLETKLKYAFYVSGGALGIALIELILALTGVI